MESELPGFYISPPHEDTEEPSTAMSSLGSNGKLQLLAPAAEGGVFLSLSFLLFIFYFKFFCWPQRTLLSHAFLRWPEGTVVFRLWVWHKPTRGQLSRGQGGLLHCGSASVQLSRVLAFGAGGKPLMTAWWLATGLHFGFISTLSFFTLPHRLWETHSLWFYWELWKDGCLTTGWSRAELEGGGTRTL